VTVTPLSSNIISAGSPRIITNLNSLQSVDDSITFSLNPLIQPTDEIKFAVTVDNGLYTESDTITRIYGMPVTVFNDDGSSISNWNTFPSGWVITVEDYVSSPSSITDSPYNTYLASNQNEIQTSNFINLMGMLDARLTFFA